MTQHAPLLGWILLLASRAYAPGSLQQMVALLRPAAVCARANERSSSA